MLEQFEEFTKTEDFAGSEVKSLLHNAWLHDTSFLLVLCVTGTIQHGLITRIPNEYGGVLCSTTLLHVFYVSQS